MKKMGKYAEKLCNVFLTAMGEYVHIGFIAG